MMEQQEAKSAGETEKSTAGCCAEPDGKCCSAGRWATVVILIGSMLLIFVRLGHYALWDDEAITAMTARGVWRTGDTSAWADDHNLVAYRNGLLINHFADRYTPPLQFYLLAPFMGLLGEASWVCRLPFAICGMFTVGLMVRWLWRARPGPVVWWSAAIILLTNASFFLFQRQCRYYALATLLTVAVTYFYWRWNAGKMPVWPLAIALGLLFSAQYLNYLAAVGCLILDYAIWGRKRRRLTWREWMVLIVPQVVVGGIVGSIWNPLAQSAATAAASHSVVRSLHRRDLFVVYWWNWRDMLASDFVILPLLVLCPVLYLKRRSNWLLRAPLALFVYLGVLAALTARSLGSAGNAEVRYLAPALPLCMGISILAVWALSGVKRGLMIAVLVVAGASVVMEPAPGGNEPVLGSTALMYYRELWHPQEEPYTPMIEWTKANVPAGKSVYIEPTWMTYPLMFRASGPIYAWQLKDPPRADYVKMPDIHFKWRKAPDYLIACGPYTKEMGEVREKLKSRGVLYEQIDTIHVYWKDQYRPERVWRTFRTTVPKVNEEIYIYRRVE